MKKKGGFLWYILVGVLVLALAVIIGMALTKDNTGNGDSTDVGDDSIVDDSDRNNQIGDSSEEEEDTPPEHGTGTEMFVMFGVDSRSDNLGKGTRSDSLMLIKVDHDLKQVHVVSIYRDCMVYQEGKGYKKITEAHSYGGPEYALSVINENFDLNIENFCTVNFNSVGDLIDMVGGVEMEITEDEVKYINGYIKETNSVRGTASEFINEPGVYLLDGTQAVSYSRIRYTVGWDYKRTERQRDVLFKVFEKSKTMSTVKRLEIVDALLDEINTNYSQDDMLVLMYYISEYEITTMTAYPKVFFAGVVDGNSFEVPYSLVDMNADLHRILLGETDYVPSEKVVEYSETMCNKVSGPNKDQRENEDDGE